MNEQVEELIVPLKREWNKTPNNLIIPGHMIEGVGNMKSIQTVMPVLKKETL